MTSFTIKLDRTLINDIEIMALPIYGFTSITVDWGVTVSGDISDVPVIYTYTSSDVTFVTAANYVVTNRSGTPTLYTQDFIITVTGDFTKFGAGTPPNGWNSLGLISIDQWGSAPIEDLSYACDGAVNLLSVPATLPSTVTNVSYMFNNATTFIGDISGWNTGAVTNMAFMFYNATAFNGNISGWNTGAVTNMAGMFQYAEGFNSDISGWNTGAVRNMSSMFQGATNFDGDISGWNTEFVEDMSYMFFFATAFKGDISKWNTMRVGNMSNMFNSATNFKGDISGWNTGAVRNMSNMFNSATIFNGDISKWNTEFVEDMSNMFNSAHAFDGDISRWNTGAVTDMSYMFVNALSQYRHGLLKYDYSVWSVSLVVNSTLFLYINGVNTTLSDPYSPFSLVQPYMALTFTTDSNTLTTLPIEGNYTIDWGNEQLIENYPTGTPLAPGPVKIRGTVTRFGDGPQTWTGANNLIIVARWGDVSGLVDLSGAFYGATILTEVPTTLPSTVTNLSYMFQGATVFDQNLSTWNTAAVTNMEGMFAGATNFDQNLSTWNTEFVENMSFMFNNATNFKGDISGWNTGAVRNMSSMFQGATNFDGDISGWNTRSVENMSYMFADATTFDQNLSTWNTEDVTNMEGMFANATNFNGDISGWNTGAVTDMSYMFAGATNFDQNLSTWNTEFVENMSYMFQTALAFDQDISGWNTGAVTDMSYMFAGATNFNGDISGWNTGAVRNMSSMFQTALAFDQNLSTWNTANVINMAGMFYDASDQYSEGSLKYNYRNWPLANGVVYNEFLFIGGKDTTLSDPKSPFYLPAMTLTFTDTDTDTPVILPIEGDYTIDWGNGSLFSNDPSGTPLKLGPVKITGTVTRFGNGPQTWTGADRLTALTGWGDVSGLVDLSGAFYGASSLTEVPTTLPSTVTNLSYMFADASAFDQNLSTWNTGAVTNMAGMFQSATAFNGDISTWDTGAVTSMRSMFEDARNFDGDISEWNTEFVEDMSFMFIHATKFNGDISGWNTESVENMSYMFADAAAFNSDISGWNTVAVTNMEGMFQGATIFNGDISGWNTGAVIDMRSMFENALAFDRNLSTWNTGYVTDMRRMFYDASGQYNNGLLKYNYRNWPLANGVVYNEFLYINGVNTTLSDPKSPFYLPAMTLTFTGNGSVTLPIAGSYTIDWGDGSLDSNTPTGTPLGPVKIRGTVTRFGNGPQTWTGASRLTIVAGWGDVSGLVDLSGAFYGATNLTQVPTTLPSTVTNLSYMFADASAFNSDISGWNTAAVTNMEGMFYGATIFNQNLSTWNTGAVTNMANMFQAASAFNSDISGWNTAAVTNMEGMFYGAKIFNQNLSTWNTGAVTSMALMFAFATNFNSDISGWNTMRVGNMAYMFTQATNFDKNLSTWDTGAVTNMSFMFSVATNFKGDISGWNTESVENMANMFNSATAFNGDISGWNTGAVTDMSYMFRNATNFNSDISGWNTGTVTNMVGMFQSATAFDRNLSTWNTGYVTDMRNMFNNASAQYSEGLLKYNYRNWSLANGVLSSQFLYIGGKDTTLSDPKSPFYLPAMTLTFTGNGSVTLPIAGSYTIDWGDGSLVSNTPTGTPLGPVKITGTVTRFGNGPQTWTGADRLTALTGWGDVSGLVDLSGAFYGASSLTEVPTTLPSTVTNLSYMFADASAFNSDISGWNTAVVTSMRSMFQSATAFNGDISGWNTGAVKDMSYMFNNTRDFNKNLSTWDTKAVTNMRSMFQGAKGFNGNISGWNTESVENMAGMFAGAEAFNGNISGWNTESVENMEGMFFLAKKFNGDISGWNTGAVTDMSYMFADASAFTADLSGWAYKLGPVVNYTGFFNTTTFGMSDFQNPTIQSPRSPFYTGIPTPSNPYVPAASLVVFDTPPNPTIKVGAELFGTVGSVLYSLLNHSYTRIAELSTGTFVGTLYRPYIASTSISNKIYGAHTGGKLFSYDTETRTLDLSAGTYQGTPTGYMALDTSGNLYSSDSSGYIYKLIYDTTSFVALNTIALLPPVIGPLSVVNDEFLYGADSENRIVRMSIPAIDVLRSETINMAPTSLIVDSAVKSYFYDTSGQALWSYSPLTKLHDFSGNPLDGTQPVGSILMDPVKRVLYGICSTGGRGLGAGFRGAGTLFSFDLSSSVYSVLVNYVAGDVNRGETPLNFSITTEMGTAYLITRTSGTSFQTRIAPRVANGYAVGSAQLPGVTTTCFNHGTKILSLMNDIEAWVPVENLNIGDLVMTYLHGPRPITHIFKGVMINNPAVWHTCMYKGQKAGFEPLLVTGGHGLLVDYLTEEEQAKQENFWGRNEVVIDDKIVMIAPVSAEFTQITDRDVYTYYHFVVENDGDNDRRYGVYANGFLTETPSKNQAVVLKYKDHPVY